MARKHPASEWGAPEPGVSPPSGSLSGCVSVSLSGPVCLSLCLLCLVCFSISVSPCLYLCCTVSDFVSLSLHCTPPRDPQHLPSYYLPGNIIPRTQPPWRRTGPRPGQGPPAEAAGLPPPPSHPLLRYHLRPPASLATEAWGEGRQGKSMGSVMVVLVSWERRKGIPRCKLPSASSRCAPPLPRLPLFNLFCGTHPNTWNWDAWGSLPTHVSPTSPTHCLAP